jgi:hypothetical protein
MRTPLDLAFKGSRDYLHGTDMYRAIVESLALDPGVPFRMVIHHFARRQFDLVVGPPGGVPPATAATAFWAGHADARIQGWLEEREAAVTRRVPYDEDAIWSSCQSSGKEIRMTSAAPASFTPIEVLVALTKKLHLDAMSAGGTKWAFTQLDVGRLLSPSDVDKFEVRIDQALGTRFTKSSVFVESKRLGTIHFAGVGR